MTSKWSLCRLGDIIQINPDSLNKKEFPYEEILYFGPLSIDWTHGIEKITQHNRTFVRIEWV